MKNFTILAIALFVIALATPAYAGTISNSTQAGNLIGIIVGAAFLVWLNPGLGPIALFLLGGLMLDLGGRPMEFSFMLGIAATLFVVKTYAFAVKHQNVVWDAYDVYDEYTTRLFNFLWDGTAALFTWRKATPKTEDQDFDIVEVKVEEHTAVR